MGRHPCLTIGGLLFSLFAFALPSGAFPGEFVDSGQSLGTYHTKDVALGDLDGDGDLDVFTANDMGEGNRVYMNDGGVLTDSGLSLGSFSSHAVALGDFDGDGDLDAFVANLGPNRVYLNDGSGTFSDSGAAIGSAGSTGAALGDLDGDGDLDAFVTNGYEQPDRVYVNDGGTFTDSGQSLGSDHGRAVALGDLDGDGDLDALASYFHYYYSSWYCTPPSCINTRPQPDTIYWNDGSGVFTESGERLGEYFSRTALGDLDGDGDLDAFMAYYLGRIGAESYPHTVFDNDGSGSLIDSGQALTMSHAGAVALGDLDNDGDLDAFVASFMIDGHFIFLNEGDGVFVDSEQLPPSSAAGIALGDLDGDGDLDAFLSNYRGEPDRIYLNATH